MSNYLLTWAPLVALADEITEAGVRASLNPEEVSTPGAWVTVEAAVAQTLAAAYRVEAAVFLIAPDADYRRALDTLATLHNTVIPSVLTPDGPVVMQGVLLPDTSTPLPALRVPVHLY